MKPIRCKIICLVSTKVTQKKDRKRLLRSWGEIPGEQDIPNAKDLRREIREKEKEEKNALTSAAEVQKRGKKKGPARAEREKACSFRLRLHLGEKES